MYALAWFVAPISTFGFSLKVIENLYRASTHDGDDLFIDGPVNDKINIPEYYKGTCVEKALGNHYIP